MSTPKGQQAPPTEAEEIYGADTLWREIGCYQKNQRQFERCLSQFDKAVEIIPEDRRTLLGRSWARCQVINFHGALEDINTVLEANPGDLRIIAQKALITYLSQDFENSLIQNIRGTWKRKKPLWFFRGAMHCRETIENCIGKHAGHPLRDHYDVIRTIAMKRAHDFRKGVVYKPRNKKEKKKKKEKKSIEFTPKIYIKSMRDAKAEGDKMVKPSESSIESNCDKNGSILESVNEKGSDDYIFRPLKKSPYQPLQRRTSNIEMLMAEKYLEKMCLDKAYLKKLKKDPRLPCPNLAGVVEIAALAGYGYKTVWTRQEILRTRRPFYCIKYHEVQLSGALLRRQQEALMKQQNIAKENVENLIQDLRTARENLQTQECIYIADKAKTYIDKNPLKILPKKEMYLRMIYDLIGLAHLDVYRLNDTMEEREKVKRIRYLFDVPISREPSADSVMKACKGGFIDVKQAIWLTEKRMRAATTPLETVWLYYTLARYNIDLKKWDLGRVYARKCINMARILSNYVWATNAGMLITKAHVQQGKRNEAKSELLKTKEMARNLQYKEIIRYINKCLEVVESIDVDEAQGSLVIQRRELDILGVLMQDELKIDVSHLFAMMSAIPPARRMSIMPGFCMDEGDEVPLKKLTQYRPSIMPPSAAAKDFIEKISKGKLALDFD